MLPRLVALDDLHELRPGPDQAHVTAHDVPQLGQLVEAPAAQPPPDPGMARVAVGLVGDAAVLVDRLVPAAPVRAHRAELEDRERRAVLADTGLAEDERPTDADPDREADGGHHRERDDEQRRTHDAVEDGLSHPRVETPRRVHESEMIAHGRVDRAHRSRTRRCGRIDRPHHLGLVQCVAIRQLPGDATGARSPHRPPRPRRRSPRSRRRRHP